jgi:hypothetical protein
MISITRFTGTLGSQVSQSQLENNPPTLAQENRL